MNPSLVAAGVLALATGALQAQTMTIYGLLDTGIEYVNNVGADRSSLKRMPGQSGSLPSRLGFRGSEELGNGLSAVFTLEQGLLPDTGTLGQGGRVFGRQAFVGLSGAWGTLSLGRQYTMLFWSLSDADILGPAIYSSSSLDSYIPNACADNAIAWRGKFGGFTLAQPIAGPRCRRRRPEPAGTNAWEMSGDSRACREWSALVKYDAQNWGAALAVDELRGGAGAFGGLASSTLSDQRISPNGYIKLGLTKLGAGLIRRDNEGSAATPRSDLWYLGVTQPLPGAWILDAQLFRLSYNNSTNRSILGAVRLSNAFSKRTMVYTTVGYIDNDGALALS